MPSPISIVVDPDKKKSESKTCIKCGKKKDISEFYLNKDWLSENGKDAWCKECVKSCRTKEKMFEYFKANHRKWSEDMWKACCDKGEEKLKQTPSFAKVQGKVRSIMIESAACELVPLCMSRFYVFQLSDDQVLEAPPVNEDDVKTYSQKFSGEFNKKDLEYLDRYYENVVKETGAEETTDLDYVKKIAKQSLQADKAQDMYMAGRCDIGVVKEAMNLFDMLNKSANLAACKKKTDDSKTRQLSLGEMVLELIKSGHPCTKKIEWEKDDVDKTADLFMHLVKAMNPVDM